ncbi:MAG: DUF4384 domain-containing protein [Akkermansia sp.]|nr:DUF4384 domain-containing protein [Akkermansia sp.]
MFALLITDSTGETHIHPISPEEGRSYTLGRSEECDIALPTEIHLSRTHCILTVYGQRVYLQDNNSSNGIFVGSRRITEEYMDTEREYQIANCRMVLIRTQAAHTMPETEEDLEREAEDTPPLQEELAPAQELLPCPAPVSPPAEEEQQAALPASPEPEYEAEAVSPFAAAQAVPPPTPAPPRRLRASKAEPRKLRGLHKPTTKPTPPPAGKPIRTALKRATGHSEAAPAKKLHTTPPQDTPRIQHAPGMSGDTLGLPSDFGIRFRLLNTTQHLPEGTALKFGITSEKDCYLHLLHYDSEGDATLLVPGVAGDDNKIFCSTEMQFPRPLNNEYELIVEPPFGRDIVIALACTHNTPFGKSWQKQLGHDASPVEDIKKAIADCSPKYAKWTSSILYLNTGNEETPQ